MCSSENEAASAQFEVQYMILFLTSCHDGFTGVMMRLREGRGGGGRKRERGNKVSFSSYSWYYRPAGASTSCNKRGYSNPFHTDDAAPHMGTITRALSAQGSLVCEFAQYKQDCKNFLVWLMPWSHLTEDCAPPAVPYSCRKVVKRVQQTENRPRFSNKGNSVRSIYLVHYQF